MQADQFKADIPRDVAHAAHYGTSFVPERRAVQEQDGYAESLQQDYEAFRAVAEAHGTIDLLPAEFERYREGLKRRTLAYLHSRSRLVSVMIAGPSKFPAARMNKRGEISHKRLNELCEFRERARAAIMRTLNPGIRPIMSGDADAIERLEEKIRGAERLQAAMKECNAIIRQKPKYEPTAEKLAAIMTLGFSEARARDLFTRDCLNRIGFADYELTNNGANIRRMKERLAQITTAQATPDSQVKGTNATIEDCPAENRVRLFFPGKPSVEVRDKLKSNGFRWTPSLGCWQAYRNSRSIPVAKEVAGCA